MGTVLIVILRAAGNSGNACGLGGMLPRGQLVSASFRKFRYR
jgi:hypothetical protein